MASLITPPGTLPEPRPITHRTAEISDCGRYRYRLTREWSDARPATFVMLNPSTADADQDDATVRKCTRYAQRWGCGSLVVVNLYAWRATDPRTVPAGPEAVGPDNNSWLTQTALDALDADGPLVAAWGTHASEQRVADVLMLPGMGRLTALSVTRDGHPGHPLYLRGEAQLVVWKPRGVR
ncbi:MULTISPECIES: DUF1643 domain-containing protein [unclassified Streptomyces]|uniref:DUF1643 domain-containing protein n=1 Tax=unclassified Streptomyces TaxID=2593676 RepID=UPI00341907C0